MLGEILLAFNMVFGVNDIEVNKSSEYTQYNRTMPYSAIVTCSNACSVYDDNDELAYKGYLNVTLDLTGWVYFDYDTGNYLIHNVDIIAWYDYQLTSVIDYISIIDGEKVGMYDDFCEFDYTFSDNVEFYIHIDEYNDYNGTFYFSMYDIQSTLKATKMWAIPELVDGYSVIPYINDFTVTLTTNANNVNFQNALGVSSFNSYGHGYQDGNYDGYKDGWDGGYAEGYYIGYDEGYSAGVTLDDTAVTIFSGILSVSMVPVNFFLNIFNFEILGINLKEMVAALLTVAIIVIILRMIFGGKGGKE